ncbi:hypothetical protein WSM22_26490 [Cytophagales bacterium WSM2-2]|nr:hypothetical protein WSM22_26490 [Cytophagales bacterium WSM2-2]
MLKLNVNRILEIKGIENPGSFLMKNGFSRHTAYRLLNNSVRIINYGNLEKLCLLLNCTTNDLFFWEDNTKGKIYKDHVMNKLTHPQTDPTVSARIREMLLHKPDAVRNFINGQSSGVPII